MSYRGDVPASEAGPAIEANADAVLIDVRTDAEWRFVGVPVMTSAPGNLHLISWQVFPDMSRNEGFLAAVNAIGLSKDQPIYMLCRSGARSAAAGTLLAENGYNAVFNISDGFEGDKDADGHRGRVNGWKVSGCAWSQG